MHTAIQCTIKMLNERISLKNLFHKFVILKVNIFINKIIFLLLIKEKYPIYPLC